MPIEAQTALSGPQGGGRSVPEVKTCGKCRTEKPLEAFAARKDSRDGRHSICRACDAVRGRARYEREREARLEQARVYYQENAAAIYARNVAWQKANPEAVQKQRRRANAKRQGSLDRKAYLSDWRRRSRVIADAQADPALRVPAPLEDWGGFNVIRFPSGNFAALSFGRPLPRGATLDSQFRWIAGGWVERSKPPTTRVL